MNTLNYYAKEPVAVSSWSEFDEHIANIRAHYQDRLILYRGQRNLYPTIRSGRCRPEVKIARDVDRGWTSLASKMLGSFSCSSTGESAKAILQHYGLATHFVDLTSDSRVAAWFASNELRTSTHHYIGASALRKVDTATYVPSSTAKGYVLVLAIPEPNDLAAKDRLFDLSALPIACARPHRQKGWLLLDRPPTEPTPNSFWIATFQLHTKTMAVDYQTSDLFPPATEDSAAAKLLLMPFVQTPLHYDGESELNPGQWCVANRVLDILEYGNEGNSFALDHKWNDMTVYEPPPMRWWRNWRFDLSQKYSGIQGDISDATKIVLTPEAWDVLQSVSGKALQWPELGSDGLFFTFAALDHDKVVEHSSPYHGVWLQRDEDLIVETPMEADNNELRVGAGHVYFLKNGRLERQTVKGSCECGNAESHDKRVRSVLSLSLCLEDRSLILIQHPRLREWGFYVVITGDEGRSLKPNIDSFRRVLQHIAAERVFDFPRPGL